MDREKIIRIIDELIFEAQKEPIWKAENALRYLKKELLKEQQETGCWVNGHCSCCGEDIGSKLDTWTNIKQFLFCPKCGAKMLED